MKLIIPMAGLGKRMRPHTLATPKPLLKVAGVSIVERIIIYFAKQSGKEIEEVHYVIGEFGKDVENRLKEVANSTNAVVKFHYQHEALGTAHAIFCAKEALKGEICIAFADTLYSGNLSINDSDEAIIWTYEVKDPEKYGVVVTDDKDRVLQFIEKPDNRISNRAIVGMYYFREGEKLSENIELLIAERRMVNEEYQLTDVLEEMVKQGTTFRSINLNGWLDFGSKDNYLDSMKKVLIKERTDHELDNVNSILINPVYIGKNVSLENSSVGPYVIIEDGCTIRNSNIQTTLIFENSVLDSCELSDSMVGNVCKLANVKGRINLGDYNEIEG